MNLYKIATPMDGSYRDFFIIASGPTKAQELVVSFLQERGVGTFKDWVATEITLLGSVLSVGCQNLPKFGEIVLIQDDFKPAAGSSPN